MPLLCARAWFTKRWDRFWPNCAKRVYCRAPDGAAICLTRRLLERRRRAQSIRRLSIKKPIHCHRRPLLPLLDALSCGVALIDVDTGAVEANEAFSQQLDLPSHGLDAERIAERLKCDLHQIACAQEPVVRALENGVRVELRPGKMGPFSGLIAVVDVGGGARGKFLKHTCRYRRISLHSYAKKSLIRLSSYSLSLKIPKNLSSGRRAQLSSA